MTLNCSGCKNPNLTRDDFYWSLKDPKIKTQRQCKKCVWEKRHPKQEAKIFNIDLEWKRHYAY